MNVFVRRKPHHLWHLSRKTRQTKGCAVEHYTWCAMLSVFIGPKTLADGAEMKEAEAMGMVCLPCLRKKNATERCTRVP